LFREGEASFTQIFDSYQGWQAYAKWVNTHRLRERIKGEIIKFLLDKI